MTPRTALQKAIDAAGGHAAVARALRVTRQAIYQWQECPPYRAIAVARLSKGAVSASDLCPKIYPRSAP